MVIDTASEARQCQWLQLIKLSNGREQVCVCVCVCVCVYCVRLLIGQLRCEAPPNVLFPRRNCLTIDDAENPII